MSKPPRYKIPVSDPDSWLRFIEAAHAHYWPWLAGTPAVPFSGGAPTLKQRHLMNFKLRCGLFVAYAAFAATMPVNRGAPGAEHDTYLITGTMISSGAKARGRIRTGADTVEAYRWAGPAVLPNVMNAQWEFWGSSVDGTRYFRVLWQPARFTAIATFGEPEPPCPPQPVTRGGRP